MRGTNGARSSRIGGSVVVHAIIQGEAVVIYQRRLGAAFLFVSEGRFFHNHANAEALALEGRKLVAQKRDETECRSSEAAEGSPVGGFWFVHDDSFLQFFVRSLSKASAAIRTHSVQEVCPACRID